MFDRATCGYVTVRVCSSILKSWPELQAEQAQFTERPVLLCQASLQPWPPCMPYVGDDPRCCLWMSLVKLWHSTRTSWHIAACGYSWVKFKDTCYCFTTDHPILATHNLTMPTFHCLKHIACKQASERIHIRGVYDICLLSHVPCQDVSNWYFHFILKKKMAKRARANQVVFTSPKPEEGCWTTRTVPHAWTHSRKNMIKNHCVNLRDLFAYLEVPFILIRHSESFERLYTLIQRLLEFRLSLALVVHGGFIHLLDAHLVSFGSAMCSSALKHISLTAGLSMRHGSAWFGVCFKLLLKARLPCGRGVKWHILSASTGSVARDLRKDKY